MCVSVCYLPYKRRFRVVHFNFIYIIIKYYIMSIQLQTKIPRKRVANFTPDEKAVLAQIIKKNPIVETKLTDGKSIAKKHAAWDSITQEFNSNANVHKRETVTLKRAWDNMKAFARKARAAERGNLLKTGGGPHAPPPTTQLGAIVNMVEEAAPTILCEIQNQFDSDGAILNIIKSQEPDSIENDTRSDTPVSVVTADISCNENIDTGKTSIDEVDIPQIEDTKNSIDFKKSIIKHNDQVHRTSDYVKREGLIRIRHLENKKKVEIQILKTQLEVEQIKKRTALLDQERNQVLLEKAKLELEEVKQTIYLK